MRNAYGNLAAPMNGYLWDACARAKVTYRSYGEFADKDGKTGEARATVPGLEGHVAPSYPPWDLDVPDMRRVEAWHEEFKKFEADDTLPALSILRLGGDHTQGTRAGKPTPRAMIAENDQALGRLVEIISHSKYWSTSAIFVLEDDAQNGPDHVDAHRSPAFVISPYSLRDVDSTLYTTSATLRTMELILGLPPMSQYDASARPMYRALTNRAVPAPFTRKEPQVSLTELNGANPDATASEAMNFVEADRTPELELNEILWRSMHGPKSAMPPPRHAAFIRTRTGGDGDGDDDDWLDRVVKIKKK
jgi:hypothetical protein